MRKSSRTLVSTTANCWHPGMRPRSAPMRTCGPPLVPRHIATSTLTKKARCSSRYCASRSLVGRRRSASEPRTPHRRVAGAGIWRAHAVSCTGCRRFCRPRTRAGTSGWSKARRTWRRCGPSVRLPPHPPWGPASGRTSTPTCSPVPPSPSWPTRTTLAGSTLAWSKTPWCHWDAPLASRKPLASTRM